MPYRCPYRLSLSSQPSRSCAGPNIKVLKDKDLEFANSIRTFMRHSGGELFAARGGYRNSVDQSTQDSPSSGGFLHNVKTAEGETDGMWCTASALVSPPV